jgi:hypothetical protein
MEPCRVCRTVVADSNHFGEEQDPDPGLHSSERSDPDPLSSEKSDPDPLSNEKLDRVRIKIDGDQQPCFF